LRDTGCNIYTLKYPGTYAEPGFFGYDTVVKSIRDAIGLLNELPLVIVTYSFSTAFIHAALEGLDADHIECIYYFSPIFDLGPSITSNFLEDIAPMVAQGEVHMARDQFSQIIDVDKNTLAGKFLQNLQLLDRKGIRQEIYIGMKDQVIDIGHILSHVQTAAGENIKLHVREVAGHKLDELWG
jgi:hypothetical protein